MAFIRGIPPGASDRGRPQLDLSEKGPCHAEFSDSLFGSDLILPRLAWPPVGNPSNPYNPSNPSSLPDRLGEAATNLNSQRHRASVRRSAPSLTPVHPIRRPCATLPEQPGSTRILNGTGLRTEAPSPSRPPIYYNHSITATPPAHPAIHRPAPEGRGTPPGKPTPPDRRRPGVLHP